MLFFSMKAAFFKMASCISLEIFESIKLVVQLLLLVQIRSWTIILSASDLISLDKKRTVIFKSLLLSPPPLNQSVIIIPPE